MLDMLLRWALQAGLAQYATVAMSLTLVESFCFPDSMYALIRRIFGVGDV